MDYNRYSEAELSKVLEFYAAKGVSVIRFWAFSMGTPWSALTDLRPDGGVTWNEKAFERLDFILKRGRELGLRFILPLVSVEWRENFYPPGSKAYCTNKNEACNAGCGLQWIVNRFYGDGALPYPASWEGLARSACLGGTARTGAARVWRPTPPVALTTHAHPHTHTRAQAARTTPRRSAASSTAVSPTGSGARTSPST